MAPASDSGLLCHLGLHDHLCHWFWVKATPGLGDEATNITL